MQKGRTRRLRPQLLDLLLRRCLRDTLTTLSDVAAVAFGAFPLEGVFDLDGEVKELLGLRERGQKR